MDLLLLLLHATKDDFKTHLVEDKSGARSTVAQLMDEVRDILCKQPPPQTETVLSKYIDRISLWNTVMRNINKAWTLGSWHFFVSAGHGSDGNVYRDWNIG